METLDYSIKVLAWIGLICASLLASGTLYLWTMLLWESALNRAGGAFLPIGLWRATKIIVQLSLTKKKEAFVAHLVAEEIGGAFSENREFKAAFDWEINRLKEKEISEGVKE